MAEGEEDEEADNQARTTAMDSNNRDLIFITILDQNHENDPDKWLQQLDEDIKKRFQRMPRGWWSKILTEYQQRFDSTARLVDVKNRYNRIRNQQASTNASILNRISPDECTLPYTVKNTELYRNVQNTLLKNIHQFVHMKDDKTRTKKVYSQDISYDVIMMINMIITTDKIQDKITTLSEMNNAIYACQRTYEEVTTKPFKKSTWKEAIQNKIRKIDKKLETINQHGQDDKVPQEMKNLCRQSNIHSNNQEQIQILKDKLFEESTVYKKKIEISEKRIAFRKDNRMWEFNRRMFYRKMEEDNLQVGDDIDKEETLRYWQEVWSVKDNCGVLHEDLQELLNPIHTQIDISEDRIKKIIANYIKYLPNWKTPGHDNVYNFFIKKLAALQDKLIQLIYEAISSPETIDDEFYLGTTFLVPKKARTTNPEELRPITCLPNIYKIISKVIANLMEDVLSINGVISSNQMGTRKQCQGAKEQALINKNLNKKYNNELKTSWIDIRKAYDSVRHDYLLGCITKLKMPNQLIEFVKNALKNQRTNLICAKKEIGQVKIANGILQGDAMSSILFVLVMEPLSRILNERCPKLKIEEEDGTNHLIFIDDIKLLAEKESTLVKMCKLTGEALKKMGFNINQDKSANNVNNNECFGKVVDDVKGYKHLGILENSKNLVMAENKNLLTTKVFEKAENLCKTKLNARNLFRALNEYAISTLNYYIGLVPFEPDEFENLDKGLRRILKNNNIIWQACNIDRLYIERNHLGRGLQNIADKAETILFDLSRYLDTGIRTKTILNQEKRDMTHFGLIEDYLKYKYEFTNEEAINRKEIIRRQQQKRLERIDLKKMHGILFKDEENVLDIKESSLWLLKGNISPQQEGMYTKIQDRNIFFDGKKCPHCNQGPKSVDHLATSCGRMLNYDYKKRHNDIVRCIHFMYVKKYGLHPGKRIKNYKVENTIYNDRVRIKSDTTIITENRIENNKPDLMIHDLKTNKITLVEVGVTNKRIVSTTEVTKSRKYELLASELKLMYKADVTVVPIVITWDGLVTNFFKSHARRLDLSDKIIAYIQTEVLKRTAESIMIDYRSRDLTREVNDDDLQSWMKLFEST